MYLETEEKNNGTLDLPSGNLSIINTSIYPFSEIFSMSWARMCLLWSRMTFFLILNVSLLGVRHDDSVQQLEGTTTPAFPGSKRLLCLFFAGTRHALRNYCHARHTYFG